MNQDAEPKPKPPLGIVPRRIWQLQRKLDILDALERYADAGMPVPPEWIAELRELLEAQNQ